MSGFIKKTLLFIVPLLAYCLINGLINTFIFSKQKLVLGASTLIVGDSHAKYGINPALFHSARNIAQPAEPIVLTFWKLKYVIKTNKIDTLILSFSPNTLSGLMDLKFSKKRWSHEIFRRSYFIGEFNQIENDVEVDYFDYYTILLKNTCFYPKPNHLSFVGSFSPRYGSNLKDTIDAVERHFFFDGNATGISETSIHYLDSIVDLAALNNICLVLVGHPVHTNYYKNIPVMNLEAYEKTKSLLDKKGIRIIDKTTRFYPDSLFYNSDHLNNAGATIFTQQIITELKNPAPVQ